jgi:uncharacterized protein VirK/YbjX
MSQSSLSAAAKSGFGTKSLGQNPKYPDGRASRHLTPDASPETDSISGRLMWRLFRKYPITPLKRIRNMAQLLLNLGAHIRIGKCLREMGIGGLSGSNPELHYKYLSNYLSPEFSVRQRAECLLFNYRLLIQSRKINLKPVLSGGQQEVWSRAMEGKRYSIAFAAPGASFREGDLAMTFSSQGKALHTLCFSFVPGSVLGDPDRALIFIGGSQGTRGAQAEIREVAKAFGEICPASLLLLQLKAWAKAFGIRKILATSASGHTCISVQNGAVNVISTYDAFWNSNGGINRGNFFELSADLVFRPSSAASSSHRARARRKQERKSQIFTEMLAYLGVYSDLNCLPKPRKPVLAAFAVLAAFTAA